MTQQKWEMCADNYFVSPCLQKAFGVNINAKLQRQVSEFAEKRFVNPSISRNFYKSVHAEFAFGKRSKCRKYREGEGGEIFFQFLHLFGDFFLFSRECNFYKH